MHPDESLASVHAVPTICDLPKCHLSRPRLVDQISGERTDVTALVAGAGYGKSVLLREWLDSFPGAAAVTRVERPTSDGALVLRNLLRSLSEQTNGVGSRTLAALDRGWTPDRGLAGVLVDEMRLLSGSEVAIVIDDFHHVGSMNLIRVLDGFVRAHPGARIVLAGRGDPSAWLMGWRLEGRLLELRQKDVAFTAAETKALVRLVAGTELDSSSCALLRAKTEGWAAGVQLAALAMVGEDDPAAAVRSFAGSDQVVADYFVGRVLDHIPADLREFLLLASVLDDITVEAAAETTGRTDAGAVLRDLETRHLFITSTSTGSFRFHPMFAELLRYELRAVDHQAFADAHRRAAAHLQRTDDRLGVVQHLAEAGEIDRLADFLADHVAEVWRTSGDTAIIPWIDRLTNRVLRADPARALSLTVAVAAAGRVPLALEYVDDLLSQQHRHLEPEERVQIEWFRTICVAALGDLDGASAALARIRSESPASVPLQPGSTIWRELPLAYAFADDWQSFDREWRWGAERGLEHSMHPVALAGVRGLVCARRGFVRDAEDLTEAGLAALAQRPLPEMSAISHLHTAAALVSLEHGALAEAEQHATEALALCDLFEPLVTTRAHAEAVQAEVVRRSGRPAEALALLQQAASRARLDNLLRPHLRAIFAEVELRCACDVGDHVAARRATEHQTSALARTAGWVRFQLQFGGRNAARQALPSTEEVLTLATDQPRRAVSLLALRARAVGARPSTDRALHHAVAIASRHGLLGSLSSEGLDHQDLLRAADAEATRELSILALAHAGGAKALVDEFSARERELMQLLPTEMPNLQLASELYISLNTLKTHLKTIYRKLGVASRAEAVRRARELGFLPPRDRVPTHWSWDTAPVGDANHPDRRSSSSQGHTIRRTGGQQPSGLDAHVAASEADARSGITRTG